MLKTCSFEAPLVGGGAIIGRNATILQGVTVGEDLSKNTSHAYPVIGSGVVLGCGAKLLGGIRIGNHAVVGANSVVITDLPDDCTAVGVPARSINRGAES
jgi:serine O-acetyltransferase